MGLPVSVCHSLSHLVTRCAIPPPAPPLTTRHSRSGRQAAMPTPPAQSRWSTEHSGRQGLDAAEPPPGTSGSWSPPRCREASSNPSPGLRYTILSRTARACGGGGRKVRWDKDAGKGQGEKKFEGGGGGNIEQQREEERRKSVRRTSPIKLSSALKNLAIAYSVPHTHKTGPDPTRPSPPAYMRQTRPFLVPLTVLIAHCSLTGQPLFVHCSLFIDGAPRAAVARN